MCIAIPALVTSVKGCEAVAEIGGQPRQINVFFTPEVTAEDYVLLNNGYAMRVISKWEAFELFELLEEISKVSRD